jgi:autotransporter-associated beta strand protein
VQAIEKFSFLEARRRAPATRVAVSAKLSVVVRTRRSQRSDNPAFTLSSLSQSFGAKSLVSRTVGVVLAGLVICGNAARAQNATWLVTPASNDFQTAANWSPATVPTGTAAFGASSTTSLIFSADTAIGTLQFNAGAPLYSFGITNHNLFVTGAGIVNASSNSPVFNITGPDGVFFSNTSTAGNASINVNAAAGGFLTFVDSSTAGNATITTSGSGVGGTIFAATSTAGNATIVTNSGASVQFNDSSTAGAATVITNNGAVALFQQTANGGQARFITNAGGTFDISLLTSGGTTVGSIEGAGTYNLGSKQLTVGSNNLSTTLSGSLVDGGFGGGVGGSLVKTGTGTLTLAGTNTYSGATTVNGGNLEVNGSIANTSGVTVNTGGLLSGIGIINPPLTTIASGGTLAPGSTTNPTGTLTIGGNLAFQSGAIYLVHVTPSGASNSNVSGTATLTGATVNANFAGGNYVSKQYTILTSAAGLNGTRFSGLTNGNMPAGATDSLSYSADSVFLNLTAGFTNYTGLNQNQQAVANTLTNYFNTNNGIPAQFFGLSPSGLSQIDGEAATGAERAAFQLTNEFLSLMLDPFVNGRGNMGGGGGPTLGFAPDQQTNLPPDIALAYASILNKAPPKTFEQGWTAWGAAFGGSNTTKGDPTVGSNNTTASTYGFAAGMDYHLTPSTVVGFALAGAGTNWGLANALGSGRSDAAQVGVYGISWFGPAYLAGALSFSNHWFSTGRSALGDQLNANFDGQSYGARLEGGYRVAALSTFGVTPYGAVQFQDFSTAAYSETDATGGGFGLSYGAMNATDVRTELGSRFDAPIVVYARPLVLYGRVAWAHDFVSNPALSAAFQSLQGTNFTVLGAPIPHDSALTTAGAQFYLTPRWTLTAKFDGEFASGSQTYGGSGTLRYSW